MISDKQLLIHWWKHFGFHEYTQAEFQKFIEIIEEYGVDKIFDAVIASYLFNDGSACVMLVAIRTDSVRELMDSLPVKEDMDEELLKLHNSLKEEIKIILKITYS